MRALAGDNSSSAEGQSCCQGAVTPLLDYVGNSTTFRDAAGLTRCLSSQLIHILIEKSLYCRFATKKLKVQPSRGDLAPFFLPVLAVKSVLSHLLVLVCDANQTQQKTSFCLLVRMFPPLSSSFSLNSFSSFSLLHKPAESQVS